MLLFTLLISSFLCFTKADSAINAEPTAAQKCSLDLQQTIAQPETNSKQYMKMVAANFNSGSRLLFTPFASSYIANFEQEWGVTVQVNDPSNICSTLGGNVCSSYLNDTGVTVQSLTSGSQTFIIPDSGILSSMSLNLTGGFALGKSGAAVLDFALGFPNMTLTSPSGTSIVVSTDPCYGFDIQNDLNILFADGGATLVCTALDAGNTYAPVQPFSTFYGQNPKGTWTLSIAADGDFFLNGAILNYCVGPQATCTSNTMQALRNIPGFRYDTSTQTVYYTEEIFNCDGQMKMVTISRPINGLFIKK